MYRPEVHGSVERVGIMEKLDFDLNISEEQYKKDFEIEGELRAISKPTNEVIENREHSPANIISKVGDALDTDIYDNDGFPGTRMYVGVNQKVPLERDESDFREDVFSEALGIEGLPENGTVPLNVDWELSEAKEFQAEDSRKVFSEEYDIVDYPGEFLPIVVRGEYYQDAYEVLTNLKTRVENDDNQGEFRGLDLDNVNLEAYKGKAALAIELEVRRDLMESHGDGTRPTISIQTFEVDMASTFPNLGFLPDQGTYDPDQKRVEWGSRPIWPGQTARYLLFGSTTDLMGLDQVSARIRGNIADFTLSGTRIDGIFDASGNKFPSEAYPTIETQTNFTASLEMSPRALRSEGQKITEGTIQVQQDPHQVFNVLEDICQQNGIEIQTQDPPGEGTTVKGRDGVLEVSRENEDHGIIEGKRDFGGQGVVYGRIRIEGMFTAASETQEVSVFDDSEDRIVRADEGGLGTSGKSTISITAESADADLNSEFISMLENAFEGREYA